MHHPFAWIRGWWQAAIQQPTPFAFASLLGWSATGLEVTDQRRSWRIRWCDVQRVVAFNGRGGYDATPMLNILHGGRTITVSGVSPLWGLLLTALPQHLTGARPAKGWLPRLQAEDDAVIAVFDREAGPYPALSAFLGGWFHQDFDLEGDVPDVVRAWKATVTPAQHSALAYDIRDFLGRDDDLDDAFINLFQPQVTPSGWSLDAAGWLSWVLRLIESPPPP